MWYLLFALWALIPINSYFMTPWEVKTSSSQFKNLLAKWHVKVW